MSLSSTYTKLAGLVVALGFFGMGPGTALLDELKSSLERRRERKHHDEVDAVAPPGEKAPDRDVAQQQGQPHNPHLLEGALINPSAIQNHPTNKLSQDAALDFITHPFLPVTATSTTTPKTSSVYSSSINTGGSGIPASGMAAPTLPNKVIVGTNSVPNSTSISAPAKPTTTPSSTSWLSFMTTAPAPTGSDKRK